MVNIKKTEICVTEVLQSAVSPLLKPAELKNISITISANENSIVYADFDMLLTVVRNLVQNSIKYSSANDKINITATESNKQIKFSIVDRGIGMDEKVLNNLFKHEKEKIRSGTSGEQGTGLGLIICKDFVERNGGTLEVTSKPNEGTTFSFVLPIGE